MNSLKIPNKLFYDFFLQFGVAFCESLDERIKKLQHKNRLVSSSQNFLSMIIATEQLILSKSAVLFIKLFLSRIIATEQLKLSKSADIIFCTNRLKQVS